MASNTPITNVQQPNLNPATVHTYADLYAVSIDNQIDARPPSGINQAAFVYESPVEGDITRFLAFFERETSIPQIGPVRSARLYFLDWITQFGVVPFFHFGGSPQAMDKLANVTYLAQVNEDGAGAGGAFFWRDDKRAAPHNAYTSSVNVQKVFDKRLGAASKLDAWLMEDEPDVSARGANGQKVVVPISSVADYSPVWIYDSATNVYDRTVNGKVEKDSDGTAITAKNIIIFSTDIKVIDTDGRLSITTGGTGQAVIYRNGQIENVTWDKNNDALTPPHFYAADGSEAVLTNGNVWVEVVKK
jgi:hypothetical protein